jgi:hypothetical protein
MSTSVPMSQMIPVQICFQDGHEVKVEVLPDIPIHQQLVNAVKIEGDSSNLVFLHMGIRVKPQDLCDRLRVTKDDYIDAISVAQ